MIRNVARVMQIAAGEIAEDAPETGKEYARNGGLIGGPKRAAKLSNRRRSEIASTAARLDGARENNSPVLDFYTQMRDKKKNRRA